MKQELIQLFLMKEINEVMAFFHVVLKFRSDLTQHERVFQTGEVYYTRATLLLL